MTTNLPRGGKTGRSQAPRRTLHKGIEAPPMWADLIKSLRGLREKAGLTPTEMAEALGISLTKVYLLENGTSVPHPYDLCVYLAALGVKRITVK